MSRPLPAKYTRHAERRMGARRLSENAVETVLTYGRTIYARKAVFMLVGRKEVARYEDVVDLRAVQGILVVCSLDDAVITAYRNRLFRPSHLRKPEYRRRRTRR